MITPLNYQLTFKPSLTTFIFSGKEILTFIGEEKTKVITLDSDGLEITTCKLKNEKNTVVTFALDKKNKQLHIHFLQELLPIEYVLEIEFTGKILASLAGWYKSSYLDGKERKYLATTHFEPADARTVFPCIDHPAYKATFDIICIIDVQLTAVTNTLPTTEHMLKNDKKKIVFAQTPRMSTYLLYVGVGEFEFLEEKYKDIVIRGVTTQGKKEHAAFALECTKKFLQYFEEYFGYPYPLKKVDLLAIPDFAAGAMENWGAITFRENALLFYEKNSSIATRQRIAEIIAHELAHQWFGNLVTMKWWDDLWLNESFATFMANKAVHYYWPEWNIWSQYVTEMAFGGMALDALHSSHPIQVTVNHVSEINELFDEIAYDKGGSILRMLEGYIGENYFRDGLRKYIQTYAYKNTIGKNLWESLEVVSNKPVSKLMQSFITQTGFPLITISVAKNVVNLRQQRFVFQKSETNLQTWNIPLIMKDADTTYTHLFERGSDTLSFPLPQSKQKSTFLICNHDYMGFYVTEYTKELLDAIVENKNRIHHLSKLGLLHDLYFLVVSTRIPLVDFITFTSSFLENEKSPDVLHYIIAKLSTIYMLTHNEICKTLVINFSKKALTEIGYEPSKNEHPLYSYLRSTSLYSLSLFDDITTLEFATDKFAKFRIDNTSLHPDLRGIIYALVVWSDDIHYETILDHYKTTDIQEEKARYLSALGNSKNKKLLNETLDYCLSPDVRFAHILYIINAISRNPHANTLALDWLFENWEKLIQSGGGMAHMILRRILKMIIPICGIDREKDVKRFMQQHRSIELQKTFDQVWEELEINGRFVRNNRT